MEKREIIKQYEIFLEHLEKNPEFHEGLKDVKKMLRIIHKLIILDSKQEAEINRRLNAIEEKVGKHSTSVSDDIFGRPLPSSLVTFIEEKAGSEEP